jgi:cytochrome c-type biogenesis protein CcmH
MDRRGFLVSLATGAAGASGTLMLARRLDAQGQQPAAARDSSNLFAMDQSASKPVRLPPKPGARAVIGADERDALEHRIRCQCGCTLDVYTCRTTDFSCQVSPAMHRDVMSLVDGGYSAQEILDAFVGTYGERALMAPKREGFNWAGYLVPFAALGGGAAALVTVLRGMQQRGATLAPSTMAATPPVAGATAEELQRLNAAIRRGD